jgi:hypothetical protein
MGIGKKLKKLGKKIANIGKYTPFTGFGALNSMFRHGGSSPFGSAIGMVGYQTPAAKGEQAEQYAKAQADAAAAVKQAEFEATTKAGLERLALKRKKGYGASQIVNPSLGSTSTLGS